VKEDRHGLSVVPVDNPGDISNIPADLMYSIRKTTWRFVTQQASHRDNTLYSTKDQEIIVYLLTMGLSISKTKRQGRYGKVTFYFDKKDAEKYVILWTSGKPVPVSDIRDVFRSEKIFFSAIHDKI
jgi:hypothetical protein